MFNALEELMHQYLSWLLERNGDIVFNHFPSIVHEYHQQVEGHATDEQLPCLYFPVLCEALPWAWGLPKGQFLLLDNVVPGWIGLVRQEIDVQLGSGPPLLQPLPQPQPKSLGLFQDCLGRCNYWVIVAILLDLVVLLVLGVRVLRSSNKASWPQQHQLAFRLIFLMTWTAPGIWSKKCSWVPDIQMATCFLPFSGSITLK